MSFRAIAHGLRRLLDPRAADRALDDEIAQYLSAAADEHVRSGMTRAQAERQARIDFGAIESAKDAVRDAGWESIPETVRRDMAFSLRTLGRNPGFAAAVLITLAVGLGATIAMFSVLNAVLLRPLPYRDPDKLALIWTDDVRRGLHQEATAYLTIKDWRREAGAFQSIGYYSAGRSAINDNGRRSTARLAFMSGNTFSVLGVNAAFGRTLTIDDENRGARVAVISHSLWQQLYHGDSLVIGRAMTLDGGAIPTTSVSIIGVMPPSFYFPYRQTDIWLPSTLYAGFGRESVERFPASARRWTAVGRVHDASSIAGARAELARLGQRLAAQYPTTEPDFPGFGTTMTPILDSVAGRNLRTAMWVLMGGVMLVLLVACANVANLLLARGASRQHELLIRQAIGASRTRLVGQLVVESLMLALVGGLAGVALAWAGVRAVVVTGAGQVPRLADTTIDVRVLVFALGVAVLAGVIFGVAPAVGVTGRMNPGVKGTGGVRARRTRNVLVVAECALAIVLLAGAGLLLRSLDHLRSVDPGFDPSNVLAVRIEFPPDASRTGSDKDRAFRRQAVAAQLSRQVVGLPGVEHAGFVDDLFIAGIGNEAITIPGRGDVAMPPGELAEGFVSGELFDALKVRLVRGRSLTNADIASKIDARYAPANAVGTLGERQARALFEPVVVNEEFARRFFPGQDAVGKQFCIDPTKKTYWFTIVGVVSDMRRQGLAKPSIAQYFGPWFPVSSGKADLIVRTSGDPLAISSAVRNAIVENVPGAIIASIGTVDSQLGQFQAQRDFQALLLTLFATLAILLAAVGIYGVVHYSVTERTRELGVRIALGATPASIRGLVMREGIRGPLMGVTIGVAAALAATRVLSAGLYGVTPADPLTFIAVAVLLLAVAVVACIVPAIRATKVDPIATLRRD